MLIKYFYYWFEQFILDGSWINTNRVDHKSYNPIQNGSKSRVEIKGRNHIFIYVQVLAIEELRPVFGSYPLPSLTWKSNLRRYFY